jgi:hypothetical protein
VDTGWPADLTWYKLLIDWGSVIAGTVGFAAAIVAVLLTLRSERRRGTRQLRSLRSAAQFRPPPPAGPSPYRCGGKVSAEQKAFMRVSGGVFHLPIPVPMLVAGAAHGYGLRSRPWRCLARACEEGFPPAPSRRQADLPVDRHYQIRDA